MNTKLGLATGLATLMLFTPCTVFASGQDTSVPQDPASQAVEDILAGMEDDTAGFMSAADCYAFARSFETAKGMGEFGSLAWELPNIELNKEQLAIEYGGMLEAFDAAGYGIKTELEVPDFTIGYATDLSTMFEERFAGVLESVQLEEPQIPDSFTVSGMMESFTEQREQRLANMMANPQYTALSESISLQSLYSSAATFSLAGNPLGELAAMLESLSMGAEDDSRQSHILSLNESSVRGLNSLSQSDLLAAQERFSLDVKENTAWFTVNLGGKNTYRDAIEQGIAAR